MKKLPKGSKILIANDSLGTTGVQTYASETVKCLEDMGYEVVVMEPSDKEFLTISVYGNFSWTLFATPIVTKKFLELKPDAVLITTIEAPIGTAVKNVCEFLEVSKRCRVCPYTASYTTNHGSFAKKVLEKTLLLDLPKNGILDRLEDSVVDFSEAQYLRSKYLGAKRVMVNALSSKKKLKDLGIRNVSVASRGVDPDKFRLPNNEDSNPYEEYNWYRENKLPILLYLGRVSHEKDITFFLDGEYPQYHRVVAGDGPAVGYLKEYVKGKSNVHFLGKIKREDVPSYFMYADLSFFPSSFDTFGITMIESSACGTPVVAFDVPGPKDVLKDGVTGIIMPKGRGLFEGLDKAFSIDKKKCSRYTQENFSWNRSTEILLENLYPIKWR